MCSSCSLTENKMHETTEPFNSCMELRGKKKLHLVLMLNVAHAKPAFFSPNLLVGWHFLLPESIYNYLSKYTINNPLWKYAESKTASCPYLFCNSHSEVILCNLKPLYSKPKIYHCKNLQILRRQRFSIYSIMNIWMITTSRKKIIQNHWDQNYWERLTNPIQVGKSIKEMRET